MVNRIENLELTSDKENDDRLINFIKETIKEDFSDEDSITPALMIDFDQEETKGGLTILELDAEAPVEMALAIGPKAIELMKSEIIGNFTLCSIVFVSESYGIEINPTTNPVLFKLLTTKKISPRDIPYKYRRDGIQILQIKNERFNLFYNHCQYDEDGILRLGSWEKTQSNLLDEDYSGSMPILLKEMYDIACNP